MLPRIRQTPHFSSTNNNIFYHLFELDFQFGVGLVNNGNTYNNVNPQAVLEISRDGGETWDLPILGGLGQIGRYTTRCRFNRLGSARDAVFRITITDAVECQLLSCMMDYEVGDS